MDKEMRLELSNFLSSKIFNEAMETRKGVLNVTARAQTTTSSICALLICQVANSSLMSMEASGFKRKDGKEITPHTIRENANVMLETTKAMVAELSEEIVKEDFFEINKMEIERE